MSEIIKSLGLQDSFTSSSIGSNFILSLIDGTLHQDQFNTWLYQDYIFVRLFLPFALETGSRIPDDETKYKPLKDAITTSFEVIKAELSLFRKRAAANGIILPILPEVKNSIEEELQNYGGLQLLQELERGYNQIYIETSSYNIAYIRYLLGLAADKNVSWKYLVSSFWMVEQCYHDSFQATIRSPKFNQTADNSMKEFVSWWGDNRDFDVFVDTLGKTVQQLINEDESNNTKIVLDAAKNICGYEKTFFDGTFGLR